MDTLNIQLKRYNGTDWDIIHFETGADKVICNNGIKLSDILNTIESITELPDDLPDGIAWVVTLNKAQDDIDQLRVSIRRLHNDVTKLGDSIKDIDIDLSIVKNELNKIKNEYWFEVLDK